MKQILLKDLTGDKEIELIKKNFPNKLDVWKNVMDAAKKAEEAKDGGALAAILVCVAAAYLSDDLEPISQYVKIFALRMLEVLEQ